MPTCHSNTINHLIFLGLLAFAWGCGNSTLSVQSAPIQFEEASVSSAEGMCSNMATLISFSDSTASLVALVAIASDEQNEEVVYERNAEELAAAAGSLVVPARGILEIPMSFDISSATLVSPVSFTVIVEGNGGGRAMEFVGQFTCE